MNDQSQIYGVSMRGWICFVLALCLGAGVLMKIPIDTQFFTILNSVLVAYVVQRAPISNPNPNSNEKPK